MTISSATSWTDDFPATVPATRVGGTAQSPAAVAARRPTPAAAPAPVSVAPAPVAEPALPSRTPARVAAVPAPSAPRVATPVRSLSPAMGEAAIAASQLPMIPRRETPPPGTPITSSPRSGTPPLGLTASPRVTPAATPAASPGGAAAPAGNVRAPINPFLANDPNQKAKRLARALVSDMVAYHPQKREDGLRAGTLKQLFREEIKKSYEEYVDQVGKEFADTTSHFQDALNDVLAGGARMF